ncbi:MAG: hypothetical protein ACI4WY_12155 [Anaerovoracaceae bacterium]
MRTNEERTALVRRRMREIREEQLRKKQKIQMAVLGGVCLTASLSLLVVMGSAMPQILSGFAQAPVSHTSGTASLLAGSEALGYVIMAIFAFLLGVCVTLLLHVIHRRQQRQRHESGSKESGKNE